MPGVTNPGGFNLLGQPNLIIKIDREKAARYGFSVADINSVVQAAIGGQEVTRVYEGEMNFALTVRFAPEYRRNIDAIRSIPVALPEQRFQGADRLYRTGRARRCEAGDRRRLHLPREQPALRAAQVQRARPRSRLDRRRGAEGHRREGAAAAGLPHRVDRRVRRAGRSPEAARRHRAAQPAPDHDAALQPVQFRAGQPARAVRHSLRGGRRHPRALRRRAELQRLGRDRLHLAVRRLVDGRHPAGLLHPQEHGRRAWSATRRSSSPAKPACGRFS